MSAPRPAASLRDLVLRGKFAGLRLGASHEQVKRVLGPPEGTLGRTDYREAALWAYGNIEFHFERQESAVWLIFTNQFHVELPADAGPGVDLDPWVLRPLLTLDELRAALDAEGARYIIEPDPAKNDGGLQVRLPDASSKLLFIDERFWRDSEPPACVPGVSAKYLLANACVSLPQ